MTEGPCVKCGKLVRYEFIRVCDPCLDKMEAEKVCPCCGGGIGPDGKCDGKGPGQLIPEINGRVLKQTVGD
jgi:hypothetical protein